MENDLLIIGFSYHEHFLHSKYSFWLNVEILIAVCDDNKKWLEGFDRQLTLAWTQYVVRVHKKIKW